MRSKAFAAAAGLLVLVAVVAYIIWLLPAWRGEPSPAELAEQALHAGDAEHQAKAAARLASLGEPARGHLRDVLRQSDNPNVRASAIQGLAALKDYQSMDLLLAALEDESVLVRSRAGVAVTKLIGRKHGFDPRASEQERQRVITRMRKDWEFIQTTDLFKQLQEELHSKRGRQ